MKENPRVSFDVMLPKQMTVKVKGRDRLIVMEGGKLGGMEMLYLGDTKESYAIDRNARIYIRPPVDMNNVSEKAEIIKTSETSKIFGYTCTKYAIEITKEGETHWQFYWMTTDIKGFDAENPALLSMVPGSSGMLSVKIEGVPLRIEIRNSIANIFMDIAEVKQEKFAATDFVVPTGFTEFKKPKPGR